MKIKNGLAINQVANKLFASDTGAIGYQEREESRAKAGLAVRFGCTLHTSFTCQLFWCIEPFCHRAMPMSPGETMMRAQVCPSNQCRRVARHWY